MLPHAYYETMSEAEEQTAVIEYCDLRSIPVYHIPNERKCSGRQGASLKRQGVRPGIPDLCVPLPRGGYGALYIEMKAEGGKITEEQVGWIHRLREYGNMAAVCYGSRNAIDLIELYLAGRIKLVTSAQ